MAEDREQARIQLLREWKAETNADLAKLDRRLEPLLKQKGVLESNLAALEQLLAAETRGEATPDVQRSRSSLSDSAYGVLRSLGEPVHYKSLLDHMVRSGISVPGKVPEKNLLAHLSRDGRFVQRGPRGVYELAEWDDRTPPPCDSTEACPSEEAPSSFQPEGGDEHIEDPFADEV